MIGDFVGMMTVCLLKSAFDRRYVLMIGELRCSMLKFVHKKVFSCLASIVLIVTLFFHESATAVILYICKYVSYPRIFVRWFELLNYNVVYLDFWTETVWVFNRWFELLLLKRFEIGELFLLLNESIDYVHFETRYLV